ncbi:probable thiopurine S-methyltransferase [Carassius auratus]|uniref:thiopurine S-methyltransferase n=1 Tax=Carassius auratus TaxID=7957 RepID=A0A6P6LTJ8_CARAU|nr:probable thiopurine S-methyltransferase [Carassius auratus]XP_026087835.1 probable thiopurine S-methyltransferase [Carassius auratus]
MSTQANRVMALSEWEDRWQEGKISFHRPDVHNLLEKNLDKVICGRKEVRFFFPLCGKAVDMKWLADMGHTVVGVEISEKGIKQFFAEQSLAFNEESVPALPGAKVFKSADGKISIYQCDLYKISSAVAGKFGGIWDRGAMVAINPCDRQKYATLLMSLMNNDCRYLLDTMEYNPEQYKGPPFLVLEEDVKSEYGGGCDIELLESVDAFVEKYRSLGLDSLTEKIYLLTLKAQ